MKLLQRIQLRCVRSLAPRLALSLVLTLQMATLAHAQPKITGQPADQFVDVGKTVQLNPLISSATPYTNQWFFNGAALADATNVVLRFLNAQPSLNGDYFVVISNDSGSITSQVARLKVFVPAPHSIGSLQLEPEGSVTLGLLGQTTAALGGYYDLYPLQASSNLVDWIPLTTLQRTNALLTPLTFLDTNVVGARQRFYRTPTNLLVSPVPPLTGPYPVGTFSRLLTDPTRAKGATPYQFMTTVWYPAAAGAGMIPAAYADKAVAAFTTYYSTFGGIVATFRSHSVTNVPLAAHEVTYPVVLYSPFEHHHRRENTGIAEELASQGYVVVGLDTLYTHVSVFPDGSVHNNFDGDNSANLIIDMTNRVLDLQWVMDELGRWNASDPLLGGHLDLDHIGGFGLQLGGAAVTELGRLDSRCKAVANLNGGLVYTNLFGQPFAAPFLMVRADDAPDPDPGMAYGVLPLPVMDNRAIFFNQAHTNAYWLKLGGTIEMSFNDPALVLDPATLTNTYTAPLNGQILSGARVHQILRASLTSFFDKHLRGLDDHLLDGPLPPFPEVIEFLSTFRGATGPEYPAAGLTQGSDGNLYGSTAYGGANGAGTLFRVTPSGELTTLVSFNGTNGAHPMAALLKAGDGSLYGTTADGGTNGDNGTVFQMTTAGSFNTLLSFAGTNGRHPYARLTQGSDGNLYGSTALGGLTEHGTVFQMTPAGVLKTLVSFSLTKTGAFPVGALLEDGDGSFLGTTANGSPAWCGTVFKLTPAGQLTNLVAFAGANGGDPWAALVPGADGNYYGTTEYGGNTSLNGGGGLGTVFRMTPAGRLTTLVVFNGANGSLCLAPLLGGQDGNFYGTTYAGGAGGCGTVFKMTPAGVLTTLVAFNGANGRYPQGPLVQGSDGNFYGTTEHGGPGGAGTVFQMTPAGALTTLVAFGTRTNSP